MQATMTYVLSYVLNSIPPSLLDLAFKPRKFNTTVENRIVSQIIEGPILLDTNLVGGKRRDLYVQASWQVNVPDDPTVNIIGQGVQASFYIIPPEAREGKNISSVIGVTPYTGAALTGSGIGLNGVGGGGNTANSLLSEMLNSRTFGNYPVTPMVTLEGTNMIRFYPDILVDGMSVSVMLENDAEFLNINTSAIIALQKLCLCATQRYIANTLRISVDETEIVAGMEIGVIKSLIDDYAQEAKNYNDLLMKFKGAVTYDAKSLTRLIYHAL